MDFCQVDGKYITGVATVLYNEGLDPDFKLIYPSAWDFIELNNEVVNKIAEADYFVFDSVAARNSISRKTLFALLKHAKTKVFSVNLRAPHYEKNVVEDLLFNSDIVKMNAKELEAIVQWQNDYFDELSAMNFLKTTYNIQTLIVTKGEEGVLLNIGNKFYHHQPYTIQKQHGVDASDAFLAAFLSKISDGALPSEILDFCCATESVVASLEDEQRDYKLKEIFELIGVN